MKRIKTYFAAALMAVCAMSLTGCEEDPWIHGWDYRDYNQGWYDDYDWYDEPFDYGTQELTAMAQKLRGHWEGMLRYYYIGESGQYEIADMDVHFEFDQYDAASLNGRGRETDYVGNESQELRFSWYIDPRTGDIYVRYDETGKTYVLDADANSDFSGFYLDSSEFSGVMEGYNNKEYLVFDCTRTTLAKENTEWEDLTGTTASTKGAATPKRIKGERNMRLVSR